MKLSNFFAAAAVAVVSLAATAVVAQQDPIAARKALMKESGQATAAVVKMTKGETPFDLATAQKSMKTYQDVASKMPALFPDNSKTGGETTAAPAIWENMNDFKARFVKFEADAKAAEASIKDLDSLKAAVANVTRNCGGCHETYRVKKS
ncbi:cytochrome c [Pseudolabrys sp. FHR47]|uniref:c-type cytochrome n=1 Tax=Pseudolabrys sp. FHR47 TaxID=2562284 RepID=UPI0010BEF30D|nr:cytochrome c [Pseudolabrys sp. FHR47]